MNVKGGGYSGQAGAIRHGISRALLEADPDISSNIETSWLVNTGCPDERTEKIRSQRRPSCTSVLQALIYLPSTFQDTFQFLESVFLFFLNHLKFCA